MTMLELHPLCTLFPRMAGAEFDALRDDIKANGLRSPIVLHDGMILDGGNRYRACVEAGVTPAFVIFDGGNLVAFVLSANMHRRHMTPGQQAAIVASAQDWGKAQASGRPQKECNVAPFSTAQSRSVEAGVSVRTQKMADKVARADPLLAVRVAHGEVSLPAAYAAVSPMPVPKLTPKQAEAAQLAHDAHSDFDPMAEIERMQREIEALTGELKAAEADDLKAEAIKWRRMYDNSARQQSEAMEKAHRETKRHEATYRKLMRCGKAVGEDDPDKVAPAVEAFVRHHRVAT